MLYQLYLYLKKRTAFNNICISFLELICNLIIFYCIFFSSIYNYAITPSPMRVYYNFLIIEGTHPALYPGGLNY